MCYPAFRTGERAHITLHTFRRSRGVHLLQHGNVVQDLQIMYHHSDLHTTEKCVEVGRNFRNLRGEVTFEEEVLSLLRQRLDTRYQQSPSLKE